MNGPKFWSEIRSAIITAGNWRGQPMIAGGCVRDWLIGLEPKDIDVFVSAENFVQPTGDHWEQDPVNPMPPEIRDGYEGLNNITAVSNLLYKGQAVQIIELAQGMNPHEYVYSFDMELLRGSYDERGLVVPADAIKDIEQKQIFISRWSENTQQRAQRFLDKVSRVEEGWRITGANGQAWAA